MKTISSALDTHLNGEVTTIATCWKIVRRDGVVFGFTDHDQDLVVDGITYEAESSYSRTAISSTSDFGVANLDVTGVFDSEKITEYDMRNGLFNRAEVYIFVVNWADTSQGIMKVRRGWFGEVNLQSDGQFTTEIRGLEQALTGNWIELFSAECRNDFCDARCRLNKNDYTNYGTVTSLGSDLTSFFAAKLPDAPTTGTSVGAHKTWGIAAPGAGDHWGFAEIRFWDQSGNLITGGTVADTAATSAPPKGRDGRMDSSYVVTDTYAADHTTLIVDASATVWYITFPTAVDVRTFEIISDANGATPAAFDLVYTTADPVVLPVTWTVAKNCTYTWTANGQSAVWGIGSSTSEPINVSGSPVTLPPPYTGASTYIGGTVEWLTGRNKGRVVEVLGYNGTTHQIDMFEGMYFPIQIGDTFKIIQGCDKTLPACKVYNNVVNRQAEDYVPGQDELMSYPNAK